MALKGLRKAVRSEKITFAVRSELGDNASCSVDKSFRYIQILCQHDLKETVIERMNEWMEE